jgi:thymidylate synthase ThyX
MANITIIDGLESLVNVGVEAARGIVEDLSDRRGLNSCWDGIEPDIQATIVKEWAEIIAKAVHHNSMSPEDLAMLQALYSRSPDLVATHMEKVRRVGSGKFMGTFYKGYGHASIGDCGTTSIFVEGVSMLAAKAIQDWPLYSGQEASTRYMDFSTATFENPLGTPEGAAIQERWRHFYVESMPTVQSHLRLKYPRKEDEDEKTYGRAIAARAFDIMRAFLPAGAHTNLSWTTNLRQASDKLRWLMAHPDPEVSQLGSSILVALKEKYPNSFGDDKAECVAFRSAAMLYDYFLEPEDCRPGPGPYVKASLDMWAISRVNVVMADRPRGVELPPWFAELGWFQSEFQLDFGSFRDLQRHRAGTIRMPLLTTALGFHQWYLDETPEAILADAVTLIAEQKKAIQELNADPVLLQNYVSMGFLVSCRVTQPLPAFVYRLELRSSKTVHPTLRQVTLKEIEWLRSHHPSIAIHADMDEDSWTVRRGKQTIEEKS